MIMDFEASDKRKFGDFDDDDGNFHDKCLTSCEKSTSESDLKELVSCEEFEFQNHNDNDDVPFTPRLSPISSFATCNCKHNVSVKMWDRDATTMPVKRVFDNNNSLHISVKKSKVALDDNEKEDNISLSPGKSASVEKSYNKCKRKRRLEEKRLRSITQEIEECCNELRNKKTQVSCVRRINEIAERKEEELKALSQKIAECTLELEAKKKELQSERKTLLQVISTRQKHNVCAQMKNFESMKKQFEGQVKELESKLKQCEGQVEELEQNEKYLKEWVRELESRDKQLKGHMMEFELMEAELESRKEELESKEKLVEGRMMEFELMEAELESRKKELESKEKLVEGRMMEFELMEAELESRKKELESKEKLVEGRMMEFELMEAELESRKKELESKEKLIEGRMMEFELMEAELESRKKELESKEKLVEGCMVEFELMEAELESRKKELESKEKLVEGCMVEFELMEAELESRKKELESKEKLVEGCMVEFELMEEVLESRKKELESKEKLVERREMEIELKENQLESREKKIGTKEQRIEEQEKELQSKENQFVGRVKEFESEKDKFEVNLSALGTELVSKQKQIYSRTRVLESKEKQFEEQVKEFESKLNKFDEQLKEPELVGKQYETSMNHIDEEKESGATLRLIVTEVGSDTNDQLSSATHGVESLFNDIYFSLQLSSDPSELVLDILQNPNSPLYKNDGDKALIINDSHIYLLEILMLISPNVKPRVREEALKLALDLKANMKENTENSLAVTSFLLLLSIYGLLTYFNDDEVLELFTFVAQHKIALKMFKALGFANKVSDFVENLIRRKEFVGAVRFSCAYNLAGKNQSVDMLREHVQNAKLICDSSCEKTDSIEIKDKARDEEIASLRTVLQCISDNNIVESEDLLKKEIRRRILELKAQNGN